MLRVQWCVVIMLVSSSLNLRSGCNMDVLMQESEAYALYEIANAKCNAAYIASVDAEYSDATAKVKRLWYNRHMKAIKIMRDAWNAYLDARDKVIDSKKAH